MLPDPMPGEDFYGDDHRLSTDEIYGGSRRSVPQTPLWDVFRVIPIDDSNSGNQKWLDLTVKVLKVVTYIITFTLVLMTTVIAKGTLLFMTSQLKPNKQTPYCVRSRRDKQWVVSATEEERSQWIWCIFLAFAIPEFFTLFRSARICTFKSFRRPTPSTFYVVLMMETIHTVGVALLTFVALPQLDAIKAAMLTNCVCFVPAVLALLSRHRDEDRRLVKIVLDIFAIIAQLSGLLVWPFVLHKTEYASWSIPLGLLLTSVRWWENYVDRRSSLRIIQALARVKDQLYKGRYFVYVFVSIWKVLIFFCCMVGFVYITTSGGGVNRYPFLRSFISLRDRHLPVEPVNDTAVMSGGGDLHSALLSATPLRADDIPPATVNGSAPISLLLIQVIAGLLAYIVGKFACRICIQGFSYAFPVNLTVPVTISFLIAACGIKNGEVCFLEDVIPKSLYWSCPGDDFLVRFLQEELAWVWLLWILSQTWITLHIWTPKCERLASTEKLFVAPFYIGFLIDQSLGMNRRRDEEQELKTEELDIDNVLEDTYGSPCYETISEHTDYQQILTNKAQPNATDQITHIFACATMWHETTEEMIEMLKSIFRMDEDQSARRNAQKYLHIVDPDYYEFETHIFFDDAFEMSDDNEDEQVVNGFVKKLVEVLDEAGSKVHQCQVHLKPPKKLPTPYGGRLVWTLPGKTKLIAHLKDKMKIRHRKRWSQVMYMYYLLGYKLMERDLDVARKEVLAENTYILTLDGDIDFQPQAVQLLVDLMKKNRNLGAACGRIHPVGSGPMVWYQKFEYAIGHWLQKATEHMIGCVLCSPGCFSLFRAKALMDDNVMKKYTTRSDEPRHYVQYDQGEDRWLCTLLLQRGYRVEYSAASDAYTHCPEGFGEFYNQRRRWVPSTMANILDLLIDAKKTVKVNDNISMPYITYQGMLMAGTILGPGTIFLMLVGAFVAVFRIDNWTSFYWNVTPILLFIFICFVAKPEIQLVFAQILSAVYALVMMAVFVGISLQMQEDGVGSPSFIFLVCLMGSFVVAAILHPQEFGCIGPLLLYYLSIPSMYLLLILYSLINLNIVTWGTREVQTKKTKAELEEERKQKEVASQKKSKATVFGLFGGGDEDEDGGFVISLGNLCTLRLFTHPKPKDDVVELMKIEHSLQGLEKRLETIQKSVDVLSPQPVPFIRQSRSSSTHNKSNQQAASERDKSIASKDQFSSGDETSDSETIDSKQRRDDLINPFWIEDRDLRRGEVEYLPGVELQFWKNLIEKYLFPIDHNKDHQARIAAGLKELRNKAVFFFVMFNALFITIVFLLQLNKDQLYINWPLGVKNNITYIPERGTVHIEKEYLHLEPIGFLFVIFFAFIIVIQFIAMLFHRFGTFSHILASTDIMCCSNKVDETKDNIEKNAVEIARAFQRLRGLDGEDDLSDGHDPHAVGRRKTIHNLERAHIRKQRVGTLDVAFRKRFFKISEGNADGTPILSGIRTRQDAMRVLENRKNAANGRTEEKERMHTLGAKNSLAPNRGSRHRASAVHLDSLFKEPQSRTGTPANGHVTNNAITRVQSPVNRPMSASSMGTLGKKSALPPPEPSGITNDAYQSSDSEAEKTSSRGDRAPSRQSMQLTPPLMNSSFKSSQELV